MSSDLVPFINLSFEGKFWQVKSDSATGKLAIEIRNEEEMSTTFYVVDIRTGAIEECWIPESLDWWSSLTGIYGDYLLISSFKGYDNPGPATLFIINRATKAIVEQVENFVFDSMINGTVSGYVFDEKKSKKTVTLETLGSLEVVQSLFPTLIKENDQDFSLIVDYLDQVKPVIGYEYLQIADKIFMSYYVGQKKFDRYFVWVESGNEVLHLKLDEGMSGLATESFFIFHNKLVFINNRSSLLAYEI